MVQTKRLVSVFLIAFLAATVVISCGKKTEENTEQSTEQVKDSTEHPSDSSKQSEHPAADTTKKK